MFLKISLRLVTAMVSVSNFTWVGPDAEAVDVLGTVGHWQPEVPCACTVEVPMSTKIAAS